MNPLALALLFSILAVSGIESHVVEPPSAGTPKKPPPSLTHVAAAGTSGGSPLVSDGVRAPPRKKHGRKELHTCFRPPHGCKAISPHHVCCFHRVCRDISSDPFNCGRCGRTCRPGMMCCGGRCTDTHSSRRHCGGCWKACPPNDLCVFGMCGYG